jgi:hypothetical protein
MLRIVTAKDIVYTRLAMATFWRTFYHDGKVSPAWQGWGGGARPPPFTTSAITNKVVMYAPAKWADAFPLFLLYHHMYSVG